MYTRYFVYLQNVYIENLIKKRFQMEDIENRISLTFKKKKKKKKVKVEFKLSDRENIFFL